jgi:hypothetical protein
MRRMFVWAAPLAAAGALVAWAVMATTASAGGGALKPVAPGGAPNGAHSILVKNHHLIDTALTAAQPFYTTTGGQFNAVDSPTTVTCPSTSTSCSIDATMAVELLDQSGQSGNQFAIALAVDGTVLIGNYTDVAPLDGYFRTYTTEQAFGGFAPGNHTVQTMIYTAAPDFLAYAFSSYRIYKQ